MEGALGQGRPQEDGWVAPGSPPLAGPVPKVCVGDHSVRRRPLPAAGPDVGAGVRIPPICEPASRRQTQFISPPKFHSHLLEWNGFQRWPHRAPQPARGCFPIRRHRDSPPPSQSKGGGKRQSALRGAGRQPSNASEPTLNFKRLIRKRRPFPSL